MKSKNVSKILVVLLIFSLSISLGWNVVAQEPKTSAVTITFWYTESDAEKPLLLEKVDAFEAANPDITVTATQHGFFGVGDEFATAFIAGTEPDVLRTPRDDVISFAYDGLIEPLTDELNASEWADFIPASLGLMTYGGEIWGIPQAIDCPMYLFNKHLFNQSGINVSAIDFTTSWTWDEFSTNIATLNGTEGAYALTLQGMFYGAQPYYYGHGANFMERGIYDTEHIAVDDTKSRFALEFLKNLTDSTLTPPWVEQGWGSYIPDFGSGEVAMVATGPWEISNLLENYPQFNGTTHGNDNLGFMLLPHDADDNYGALVGGNYYTVSSQTTDDEYEAGVKLCKFLSSTEMMVKSANGNYHIPARMSVIGDPTFYMNESAQYVLPYFWQCYNAHLLTPSPFYGRMENILGGEVDQYLAGDIDLDTVLKNTIAEWMEILPGWGVTEEVVIPGYELTVVLAILLTGILGVALYSIRKKKR